MAGYRKTPRLNSNNAFCRYGVSFLTITLSCVVRFSSFMYQTNCICTGFQLILHMLTYVAPSSGRHTNYHNSITEIKFKRSKITKSFLQITVTMQTLYN